MCHVSTRGALEAIQMAKLRGAPVTCEVTPHHLWLDVYKRQVSNRIADKVTAAEIHNEVFGSDHCPVELVIDL